MCGCGGGGAAPIVSAGVAGVGSSSGGAPVGRYRVSYMDKEAGVQQFRDWPSQMEAFAHAGLVGGTISLTPSGG
jgi:hypothetical protein